MGENEDEKPNQSGQLFENFVQAATCKGTLQAFNILARQLDLDPLDYRHFYPRLKSKITTWKAKALWNKLDKRGCHKEYKRGKSCVTPKCLIIGGGPCGLRTAIELAYLGAKVVVVEKRDTFSRNNVLHLWPFTIHDLRGLGAKKFYGKFCAGSIDHISIRQLQLILFKVALLLGVEIHVNLEFLKVVEPPEDHENQKVGWRAEFLPVDHPLSEYEFDVIIGADGRRNTLEGFGRKEFRGKLAIAITANFVNRNTTAEAKVEEISGVAFIFNQKFFQDLKEETGIDLENIVYYKDSTHYFVMTAKKQSLLDKGVIINDYIDTEVLLCGENVNQENLQSYAREAADFATNYQLPSLDFAITHYGQPDVAMFDFTSMYASKNAALVRERRGHHLLVCLVGDSLLEPFWPMGTGCARGFLAAFDSAWMVKSWAQETPPLEILAERESLYRLLPQTTPENINKNFDQYTIDPGTRYPNLNSNCVRPHQVRHLYLTNELQHCPLERVSSIRRSVGLSRHESDIRPNKLLTWCQKQTEGYRNVNVINLTSSWKSGFALCAIIHRFRPDDIDFEALNEEDPVGNNQLAFDIAERELGIPPITTGKEMAGAEGPDKLSMVMYLSKFYELFRGAPLRAVDPASKENGENGNAYPAKSTTLNNFINLTAPRKRVTKVERRAEESDMHKRRRKGLRNFEEPSSFSSQSASSGSEHGDSKESQNQNKVKSMATQLLAKFEENAPNASLRRQFEAIDRIQPKIRETKQSVNVPDCLTRRARAREKTDRQLSHGENTETLGTTCLAVLAVSGILKRLQHVEDRIQQKRAQSLANREFHRKSIKDKAAHLAAMFDGTDFQQNKLPPPGLSHFQPKTPPYALPSPSHDSAASSSSSPADSVPSSGHSGKVTVGKVASGIGAVAEVLINLYMNDHRPKSCSDSMARNHLADGAIPAAASFPDPSLSSPLQNPKGSLRKEFPANLGGSDICYFCKKRVYVMERQSAEGHFFHRECFRCDFCSTTIRPGVFAYDVDEGKFYCKPHFMHCKKHNKHRKRRAELKAQDDDEMWKNETPEPSAAESMYPVSSQEDGPPDWQLIDETMSPKKSKNELEHCDFESRLSSADSTSEWTSVKVAPEEAMTDHNLLAIRVMVTSDGSSSDMESDNCDDLGNSGLCKESYFFPETVSSKKLLKRHVSMNDGGQQEKRNIKSRALDALQRASSFHSSTSSACQKWRERTLSRWAPIIGKKSEEPSKESAPCIPDALEEDHSQGEMPSQDPPSEIARWRNEFNTPTLQEKVSEEVLPYKPHSSHLLNRTSDSLLVDNDHYPSKNVRLYDEHSLIQECQDEKTKIGEHDLEEMNVYSKELPTQTDASIDRSMELSSRNAAKRDERGRGEQKEMTDQVSNEKLKRLVLSEEEKSMLLDWNSENVTPAKSENQTTDVLEKSVSKKGYNKKGKKPKPLSLTVSSEIANDSSLSFSKDQEDELRIPKADNTAGAGTDSKLKSPFKLFASAIKRSILEQLSPTPDNAKRTPDDKSKLISPSSDTDFPSPIVSSGVLRRGQSNKEYSSKSPGSFLFLNTEKVGKTSNSPSKPSTSSSNERETPSFDYGTPRRDFSTYATYSRLSEEPCKPTHDNSPYTKMEDFMPKLLEKFSLKENSSKEVMDDSQTRKRKNTLFSSLRLKDRAAVTDEKNIWNLFGSLRKKATEKETSDPLNRSSTPLFASSTSSSFSEQEAGSSNARDRTQVNEDSSASSGDEFHHNPSPPLKLKTPSKRRKKQEREAKQRAKQEEMRRLHKAQGIQRQLHEIEERQRSLEAQGVELEKALRGESDSETQDESQLLQEWFKLVLEKNKLARCESELLIIGQELELEDHQSRLEQKLREKMSVNVRQKDEKSREEEQEIFTEMMRVIEERDNLVSFLEQQRLEEKAEEKSFENFALSRGYQPSTDTHTGMRML
ncbi:F-actin-monooxygenase MICAL2 isoform X2 [Rhinatrema bivittatum]|uniref:F-actin-monooxygenase MICAL2 isoform X2 n=1 Tax=Rhinatrema bivittatum TaxID=194408 RepID=UPI00112D049A|nr:F-actin-monooxygenase MICAL2 isoform X2 [Rhinatrema bivittatum]